MYKKTFYFILLFVLFNSSKSFSGLDSLYVSVCIDNSSVCLGYDHYSKTVEHFDSIGNKTEVSNYFFNGCEHILDTAISHISDTYYT